MFEDGQKDESLDLNEISEEEGADGPPPQAEAGGADDEDNLDVSSLDAVYNVPIQVSAVLGKTTMPVNQLLKLGRGAVVELDRRVGEAIDIYVNNRLIARGEIVIVEDRLGVTMTEIIKNDANAK